MRLAWQCLNHLITVEVEIPANTTAQLFLPEQEGSITLGSGSYQYSYATETDLTPQRFTMDTPLRTMLADADAKAVLSAACRVCWTVLPPRSLPARASTT